MCSTTLVGITQRCKPFLLGLAVTKTQHSLRSDLKTAFIQENNSFNKSQILRAERWLCRGMDGVTNYSIRSKTTTTLGWKGRQRKIVLKINFEEEETKKIFDKLLRLSSRKRKAPKKTPVPGVEENPDRLNQPRAPFWAANFSRKSGISSLQTCLWKMKCILSFLLSQRVGLKIDRENVRLD